MLERPFLSSRRRKLARWIIALAFLWAVVPLRIVAQAPAPPSEQAAAAAARGSGTFERVVEVETPARLEVVSGSGTVSVRPGAVGEVRVVGRIEVRARTRGWRARPDAEEIIRRIENDPPVVVSGNVVRVGADLDSELRRYASISYAIETPADTEVHAQTGSGGQVIEGVAGPVEARAGSGRIRLQEIGGAAIARTGSGSIHAEGVAGAFSARAGSGSVSLVQTGGGDVEVATGSGSSTLSGIAGALSARAGSGSITVEGRQAGQPWELRTGSGSVRVRLPADAGFDLEARTGSGGVQTDHPVTVQGTVGRGRISGQVRGGGPALRVRTGSGRIRIE